MSLCISVAARSSKLSQAQVKEVFDEMRKFFPSLYFDTQLIPTTGDLDRKQSLRTLGKTNFFTKEIDDLVLRGECRIAIHSAKDLPDPFPEGLKIIALTRGVDSSDSLVLRFNETFATLPLHARIATSSLHREEHIRSLRSDLEIVDIRGTIEERLDKLFSNEIDGVVIAEAALIRLKLEALNRLRLNYQTTPLQGRLAIVAKEGDKAMEELFRLLDYTCS